MLSNPHMTASLDSSTSQLAMPLSEVAQCTVCSPAPFSQSDELGQIKPQGSCLPTSLSMPALMTPLAPPTSWASVPLWQ